MASICQVLIHFQFQFLSAISSSSITTLDPNLLNYVSAKYCNHPGINTAMKRSPDQNQQHILDSPEWTDQEESRSGKQLNIIN